MDIGRLALSVKNVSFLASSFIGQHRSFHFENAFIRFGQLAWEAGG